ncbi:hypothetical protein [Salimicrobium halophilum]|uniref:DUF3221 domain-containing protein n=1 Tax=Salimicrobium halophilum TaxID=86666 RepID=A0A1G8QW07_9BACI|nr:hypothetical protein [Salimicrobium halophilum]SDJ08841.1 hypothetical protein SAMN04490247_0661 [Salimicrobium halophilum]
MSKSKMCLILAMLTITLMGCSQEGTFIQGDITEIDEESGDMEIDIVAWTTVSDTDSSERSHPFKEKSNAQTIRVSNPGKYEVGQKIQVEVIKDYEEDVWDKDRLKFDVKEVD